MIVRGTFPRGLRSVYQHVMCRGSSEVALWVGPCMTCGGMRSSARIANDLRSRYRFMPAASRWDTKLIIDTHQRRE